MFEVWYNEGPGTSHYVAAEFPTYDECLAYTHQLHSYHARFTVLPKDDNPAPYFGDDDSDK